MHDDWTVLSPDDANLQQIASAVGADKHVDLVIVVYETDWIVEELRG